MNKKQNKNKQDQQIGLNNEKSSNNRGPLNIEELKKLAQESQSKNGFFSKLSIEDHCSDDEDDDELFDDEIVYKYVQRNIFLINSCYICKSSVGSKGGLKKCSKCKMINYCNKEHQIEHWKHHKDLCKAIVNVCKKNRVGYLFEKTKNLSPEQFKLLKITRINDCSKELGRELELWEKEMFYYPEVCMICYESNWNQLEVCQQCHQVLYCKTNHLNENHDKWCKEFKLYRDLIIYQFKNGMIQPELHFAHHDINISEKSIKEVIITSMDRSLVMKLNPLLFAVLTDQASCPLTVKLALEKLNLTKDEELNIHVVGAESYFELDNISKWEHLLLHLIKKIKIINITFIGPELILNDTLKNFLKKFKICNGCLKKDIKIKFDFHEKMCYHEYVNSKNFSKPHLICAFNAGIYRMTGFNGEDTWNSTIIEMLKTNAPLVVTEYTSLELNYDLQRIQDTISIKTKVLPSLNPFASLKPSLNFVSEEHTPLIYKNYFYMIVEKM